MRQGDLNLATTSLQHAMRTLTARWEDTKEHWRDNVARQFGEEYIEPLAPQVNNTLKAINRLSTVLNRAVEECS